MQFAEFIKVVKNRRYQRVNGGFRYLRGGDEAGGHADGPGTGRIPRIETGGNRGPRQVGVFADQLVDLRAGDRYQAGTTGRRRILDVGGRAADNDCKTVDLVAAQSDAVLVGLVFGQFRKIRGAHAEGPQQQVDSHFRAGTGGAGIETLAPEILEFLDFRFLARQDVQRLGIDRENRAQAAMRAVGLELCQSLVGVELDIRLHHAEIECSRPDGIDVVNRALAAFRRAPEAETGAFLVHQAADGASRGVINAGHSGGADAHCPWLHRSCRRDLRSPQKQHRRNE